MSKPLLHIYLPLAVLLLGSVLFIVFPWDMEWADALYSSHDGWIYAKSEPWDALYVYGVVPALLVVIGAFVLIMLGVGHPLRRYRKLCAYLLACMAIGPGLITNAILKGFWGRPRPKQLSEFGGRYDYETLLTIDLASFGKSFPCGHATMGFFFFALGFTLIPFSKIWSRSVFVFAWALGLLIGAARFVQGGHFPSDTLWAAMICWFVSLGLYHAFGLARSPFITSTLSKKRPWWMLPTLFGGVFAIILTISLATPYEKTATITIPDDGTIDTVIVSVKGEVTVREGDEIRLVSHGDGHRFPKSRHKLKASREGRVVTLSSYKTGFFTELNLTNELVIPIHLSWQQNE